MFRPKSPMAVHKPPNLSPSPQSKRKINYLRTHTDEPGTSKPRSSIPTYEEIREPFKSDKKGPAARKYNLKNIQVDTNELIECLKAGEGAKNNETPKFSLKVESALGPASALMCNFFSFGEKHPEQGRSERKVKENVQKEPTKSPKEARRKLAGNLGVISSSKKKLDVGMFESSARSKKPNQSYIR